MFDRFPFAIHSIKQLPRFRQAAFAHAGIVEPVHLDRTHFGRLWEIVLHPFLGAFVRPPMEVAVGMVA